jgi:protein phosphatase
LVIQNDHRGSATEANRLFPAHEIMTPESLMMDLVGDTDRPDLMNIALTEMRRRVSLKLSLGERVVVASPTFSRQDHRIAFAKIAIAQGASVVYLLAPTMVDPALNGGDGLATVIAHTNVRVIKPLPANPLPLLRDHYRGITVIADVHGELERFQEAIAWAKSRKHFIWFLGDVVDCGAKTIQVLTQVYHLVMRGEAAFILGNHERKIARWIAHQESKESRSIRLSEGNKVTVDALMRMSADKRTQWCGQFRSLLNRSNLIMHLGTVAFTHAAIHPDEWSGKHEHQGIEDFALYGEPDATAAEFCLSYRWVDAVPSGKIVFVGHDVRSSLAPQVVTGAKGGKVVFLDTGSGKGGFLSTADLRFVATGLHLENFNRY